MSTDPQTIKEIEAKVLKEYYEWCDAQGIAKKTVITFAKERGILL